MSRFGEQIKTVKTKKVNFSFLIITLVLLLLGACNEPTTPQKNSTFKKMTEAIHLTKLDSKGGNYIIQFSPKIEDIPLNQHFDLDVIVKGATGQNLAYSITLDVDAGMQTHNHGMNAKPVIKIIGKSRFKVEGMLLHMPGEWFIKFIVRRGVMSDSAKVNLSVKL